MDPQEIVQVPIEIYQGELFTLPIYYRDGDNVAIPLTGYSAKMQIRSTRTEEDTETPILEATTDNGYITITASLGEIDILIPSQVTELLPADFVGVYDVFIYSKTVEGIDQLIITGPVSIIGRVSK